MANTDRIRRRNRWTRATITLVGLAGVCGFMEQRHAFPNPFRTLGGALTVIGTVLVATWLYAPRAERFGASLGRWLAARSGWVEEEIEAPAGRKIKRCVRRQALRVV